MSGPTIRLLVVDEEEVVLAGVGALVGRSEDIRVCGEARTVKQAALVAATAAPDVALIGAGIEGGRGLEAAIEIQRVQPEARAVLWSAEADEQEVLTAIGAGVNGYLLRRISGDELLSGLRVVVRSGNLLDPALMGTVFERLRRNPDLTSDDRLAGLSHRERWILELVAAGRTNREIAEAVHLSEKTVKNHLTHILAKLGVARRSEAAAYFASVVRG